MDYEQLQRYQKSLLDRALSEGIKRSEEQIKIWSEYRERHEKVIEGLETFREELAVDCMVPIGKRALMRGKLTHTNEILVSLGEGYFAKYSAAQAIALCNRRIKRANDILEGLEKERSLYEMRQSIPNNFDAFGGEERKDLIEHWDNEKLDDWRVMHRQREKEYRKKLSELKNTEKQEIQTEEDLFQKLDALELQEELEDELLRLEASRPDFYDQDLEDGEVYEESESDSRSDTSGATEDESEDDNDEKPLIIDETELPIKPADASDAPSFSEKANTTDKTNSAVTSIQESSSESRVKIAGSSNTHSGSNIIKLPESEIREKKVIFGEPQVKYFNNNDKIENISQCPAEPRAGTSFHANANDTEDTDDEEAGEDDVIRIDFKHSDYEPEIPANEDDSIQSPRDIYKMLLKPKSILKKSPNHVTHGESCAPAVDNSSDDEIEGNNPTSGISAYSSVVKEIREHVAVGHADNAIVSVEQKRPVSKFKRERAGNKK